MYDFVRNLCGLFQGTIAVSPSGPRKRAGFTLIARVMTTSTC